MLMRKEEKLVSPLLESGISPSYSQSLSPLWGREGTTLSVSCSKSKLDDLHCGGLLILRGVCDRPTTYEALKNSLNHDYDDA